MIQHHRFKRFKKFRDVQTLMSVRQSDSGFKRVRVSPFQRQVHLSVICITVEWDAIFTKSNEVFPSLLLSSLLSGGSQWNEPCSDHGLWLLLQWECLQSDVHLVQGKWVHLQWALTVVWLTCSRPVVGNRRPVGQLCLPTVIISTDTPRCHGCLSPSWQHHSSKSLPHLAILSTK